jgi:hypothetical protein
MLGEDVAAALPHLRDQAESRMTETVEIGLWGDGVDPETGEATQVLVESRYVGKGRVRYPSYAVAVQSPATEPVAQQDVVVSIPSGSGPVFEGDTVLVTASTSDAMVIGRRFTVKGQPLAGQTTAYRISVVEQT